MGSWPAWLLPSKARAKELGREIRVIGVQAENAAAYPPSLAADALVPLKKVTTMADGIAVGRPGQLPFSIIRELVDDVVTVSEDSLARALIFLLERAKMVVEPAGAVGVAALMDGKIENPGNTAVVLSGGNIDPDAHAQSHPAWSVGRRPVHDRPHDAG